MIFFTVYQILIIIFCDFLLFDKIIRDNFFKD